MKPSYSKGVMSNLPIIESMLQRADNLAAAMINEIVAKSVEPTIWKMPDHGPAGKTPPVMPLFAANGLSAMLIQFYKEDHTGKLLLRFVELSNATKHDVGFRDLDILDRLNIALFLANVFFKTPENQ